MPVPLTVDSVAVVVYEGPEGVKLTVTNGLCVALPVGLRDPVLVGVKLWVTEVVMVRVPRDAVVVRVGVRVWEAVLGLGVALGARLPLGVFEGTVWDQERVEVGLVVVL